MFIFETIGAREQGQISKKWFRQRGQHGNGRPNVSKNIIFKFFIKKLNTNLLSVLFLAHSVYWSTGRQATGGFASKPSSPREQAGRGFEPEYIFPREGRRPGFSRRRQVPRASRPAAASSQKTFFREKAGSRFFFELATDFFSSFCLLFLSFFSLFVPFLCSFFFHGFFAHILRAPRL